MKLKVSSFILLLFVIFVTNTVAQKSGYNYTILLTGASFASPENTWFEQGCELLNAEPINRAIGGESITETANRMIDGTLYSSQELEEIDALVIMQVHNRDVFDESDILNNYKDYIIPFEKRKKYAAAYDYVIKRYMAECYELRNNPTSRYYNSSMGKPAVIVLSTHWHDGRTVYNTTIRKLAEKWGLPLIEFDKYIGFSKNALHPVTKQQHSRLYSYDTQTIEDVKYGLHPNRGKDSDIQKRMATIFVDLMKKILLVK